MSTAPHAYSPLLPTGRSTVPMRRLEIDGVTTTTAEVGGTTREFLTIEPHVFTVLAREAFKEVSHFLRSAHLESLRGILDDPEAIANDRYVATC